MFQGSQFSVKSVFVQVQLCFEKKFMIVVHIFCYSSDFLLLLLLVFG